MQTQVTKRTLTNRILAYEASAFGFVLAVLWADEFVDLPRLWFGAPGGPRWQEAAWESGVVALVAGLVLYWTRRLLRRLRYLEGFLPVCAHCQRIRTDRGWIPIVEYITAHSAALFSHGLCPDCAREHYPEVWQNEPPAGT